MNLTVLFAALGFAGGSVVRDGDYWCGDRPPGGAGG